MNPVLFVVIGTMSLTVWRRVPIAVMVAPIMIAMMDFPIALNAYVQNGKGMRKRVQIITPQRRICTQNTTGERKAMRKREESFCCTGISGIIWCGVLQERAGAMRAA
jgi:hypothetical protein